MARSPLSQRTETSPLFYHSCGDEEPVLYYGPMPNGNPGWEALMKDFSPFALEGVFGSDSDFDAVLHHFERRQDVAKTSGRGCHMSPLLYSDACYNDWEDIAAAAFRESETTVMDWMSSEIEYPGCQLLADSGRPRSAARARFTTESDHSTEQLHAAELAEVDDVMSRDVWQTEPWRPERPKAESPAAPSPRRRTSRHHRVPSARRAKTSSASPQSSGRRGKGVTMLYRTMARKLLAGSGWIMHSSISKESAKELIRILIGERLYRALQIDGELTEAERVSVDKKEHHCNRLFADILTFYIGHVVSLKEADTYVRHDKGPYRLADEFLYLLKGKPWPPHLPSEAELRAFGCYREGETPGPRAQVSKNEHGFDFIKTDQTARI